MKAYRTTIVLGVVAALLLGFIVFYERGSLGTRELESRKTHVLKRFIRKRVEKLEIQRKGQTTVLSRGPDEENDLDFGLWQLTAPYQAEADQDAVDVLLGELEWMDSRRRLQGISTEDRKRFGFDSPRYRVWFTVGRERVLVVVGNEVPQGDGVYISSEPDSAHVVGKDLVEALDHDAEHYYTKKLHPDGVTIFTLESLTLRDDQGERRVAKRGEHFWLERPLSGLASRPNLTSLATHLDGMRAQRFIAVSGPDLARYGLDAPVLEVVAQEKAAPEEERGATIRFRFGSVCGDHTEERYVLVGEAGAIHCVLDSDRQKAATPLAELREQRLLILDDYQLHGAELREGRVTLGLVEKDDAWSFTLSIEGRKTAGGPADEDAVRSWFESLRKLQVQGFLPAGDPAAASLASPATVVSFQRGDDKPSYDVKLSRARDGLVYARRAEEKAVVSFSASARELLQPVAVRFRKLRLLEEKEGQLTSIEVHRPDHSERAVRGQAGAWSLQQPVTTEADRIAAAEIARLGSSLEAVRFVADGADISHGLKPPGLRVVLRYGEGKDARSHTLHLGQTTRGGRFAQLDDDPAVFVVAPALADQLIAPLASRRLVSVPVEELSRAKLSIGRRQLAIERAEDRFVVTAGPGDEARAKALADALSVLHALRVTGYGPGSIPQPLLTLDVERGGPGGDTRRYSVAVAAPSESGTSAARRSDLDVAFELGASAVESLRALLE